MAVIKNPDYAEPIPKIWRNTLERIANAFVTDDLMSLYSSNNIRVNDTDIVNINRHNIESYPDTLGLLSEDSWKSSIYLWMEGFWEVLVDLSNVNGETTDLVLHLKVYETDNDFVFEPYLIYVP